MNRIKSPLPASWRVGLTLTAFRFFRLFIPKILPMQSKDGRDFAFLICTQELNTTGQQVTSPNA
jgi:hypothetical protein